MWTALDSKEELNSLRDLLPLLLLKRFFQDCSLRVAAFDFVMILLSFVVSEDV